MNKIKFIGATEGVTGSSTYLEVNGVKILIDIGMVQGNIRELRQTIEWSTRELEYNPKELDYVIITHAHIDHSGLLPVLFKKGFKGEVITTVPTAKFMEIALPDSAEIMQSDCDWWLKNMKQELTPPYTLEDAMKSLQWIRCYDFNTEIVLSPTVKLELKKAGHMLGASMPLIKYKDRKRWRSILFTGDTSAFTYQKPFLPRADEIGKVDKVVCESTYGDRRHDKRDFKGVLRRGIVDTCINKQGTLVIPVFAMQRSSEVLWILREIFYDDMRMYTIPIYLDSPMAVEAQRVVNESRDYWGDKWIEQEKYLGNIFEWENINYVSDYKMSVALDNNTPKIILSSSGMCSAGRVTNHLLNFLPDINNKVLLCGYSAEGTVGYELARGNKAIGINGNRADVRADVESVSFSSHADYNQLIELLKSGTMKEVFLVHGEKDAKLNFQKILKNHLRGVKITVPEYNQEFRI